MFMCKLVIILLISNTVFSLKETQRHFLFSFEPIDEMAINVKGKPGKVKRHVCRLLRNIQILEEKDKKTGVFNQHCGFHQL